MTFLLFYHICLMSPVAFHIWSVLFFIFWTGRRRWLYHRSQAGAYLTAETKGLQDKGCVLATDGGKGRGLAPKGYRSTSCFVPASEKETARTPTRTISRSRSGRVCSLFETVRHNACRAGSNPPSCARERANGGCQGQEGAKGADGRFVALFCCIVCCTSISHSQRGHAKCQFICVVACVKQHKQIQHTNKIEISSM